MLDMLSQRDHQFASGFTTLPYDGFANLHALTLDLGPLDAQSPLRLLMTGYVNYFSATSLYAAWQAGIKPIPPYVEAQLARWNLAAHSRRRGISRRPGAHHRRRPDGQAARGHAPHPPDDESGNLSGTRCSSTKAPNAEARTTEVPLAHCNAALPRLPEANRRRQPRRSRLRLRSRQPHRPIPARARQLHAHGRCDRRWSKASTTALPSSAAAKRLQRSSTRRSCPRCPRIGSATISSMPTAM